MKRVIYGALAACLAAGLSAGCEAAPPPSAEWQQVADDLTHYWKVTRGLGKFSVPLIVLEGDAAYVCNDQRVTTNYTGLAEYCRDQKSVVVGANSFKAVVTLFTAHGGTEQEARYLLLGHEDGHAVEDLLEYGGVTGTKQNELTADCLDDEAVSTIEDGAYTMHSAEFYRALREFSAGLGLANDGDVSHGTTDDRLNAFAMGAGKDGAGNPYGCGLRGYTTYVDGRVEAGI